MQGNITVAKSWNELNSWQLQEIAHLYLNTKPEDFAQAYLQMIFVVFQQSPKTADRNFLRRLLNEVTVSELEKHTAWLLSTTNFYQFPEVPGLIKPADALGDITIRQFSTIDTFFHFWNKDKTPLNLKRLVASLYRVKEKFSDLDLPEVDKITKDLPEKQMQAIALTYLFTRMMIADRFPIVFPKQPEETEEEKLKPVFKKKDKEYIPFDKMIVGISMDELQPLGTKQQANEVLIYEFLSVLSESIIYNKAKQKANAGKQLHRNQKLF